MNECPFLKTFVQDPQNPHLNSRKKLKTTLLATLQKVFYEIVSAYLPIIFFQSVMTEAAGEVVPHHNGPDQDRMVQGLFQDLPD